MNARTGAVRIAAFSLILLLVALWIQELRRSGTDAGVLNRDWRAFHRAGALLWEGRHRDIYPLSFDTDYPFLYPPCLLYPCAVLGLLPPTWAYGCCVLVALLAVVASLGVFRIWMPGRRGDYVTAALVVLASAPWNGIMVVGQITPLFVLALAAGFGAWRKQRLLTAGLILSLLMIKPNLGAVVGLVVLARGGRRMVLGLVIGWTGLLASTLPLGVAMWEDYFAASALMADVVSSNAMPMWKHQTLYAFWWTVPGIDVSARWVQLLWAMSVVPIAAGAILVWARRVRAERVPRLLGVTVLFLVAANPYCYFYDGLLLLIPGVIWYVERGRYAHAQCHRICGLCLLGIFVWQHLSLFVLKEFGPWALVGPVAWVWCMVEVVDLTVGARRRSSDASLAAVP
ncbi:MAG: DUF2029 domain-containing protein [Phycisphaerales bacterium]|nr:MAG: DUF2029 domain-containing protein [Phycisphaerales bacterium]